MSEPTPLEDLKRSIADLSARDVFHTRLMGHKLYLFEKHFPQKDPASRYDELKKYIADKLALSFNNVAIIGSAKTGYSFNPTKNFSLFSEESDIDLALVSSSHFTRFWNAYLEAHRKKPLPDYKSVTSSIFRKFVTVPDKALPDHPEFVAWQKLVGPFKKDFQTSFGIPNDINYRIYDSWEVVEAYHTDGIEVLKKQISKN